MILDQYGQPFREAATLAEPQTARIATLQNALLESQLEGMTPADVGRALRQADMGDTSRQWILFDDLIDKDAHLRCEFSKRQGSLLGLDWSIQPPKDASRAERKDAAWCEEILRDVVDDLEDLILHMQEAPGYGFAPTEIEWRYTAGPQARSGERIPVFHPRPQTWFRLSQDRRELHLMDGSADGLAPISFGWVMHQARKVKTGYLGRAGLFRPALFLFLYGAYGIGDLAELLDVWGLPIVLGKYMQGAQPSEKASLMRAVAALGRDARAIMPEGMSIEVQKVMAGGGGSNPHLELVDWSERAKSKLVLGQVLSAEAKSAGLGNGDAALHREVRRDILVSDARQVAATLTRDVVYPMLALNSPGFGSDPTRRCPRWVFDVTEAEDMKAYADALPKLVGIGVRIPESWAHEKLRIPVAQDGETVLATQAAVPAPPTDATQAAAQAAMRAALGQPTAANPTDPTAPLAAELTTAAAPALAGWVAQLKQIVDQVVGQGGSTPELQAAMVNAFGDLPTEQMVKLMAAAMALAELQGMDAAARGVA